MENTRWFEAENVHEISSPALLLYPHRIEENIRRMVEMAGDASRLRPHIKTHKLSQIIHIQDDFSIDKCKCSTIAEAELAAINGVKDILLAYQPVGPNIKRFFLLKKAFPYSRFSAIVDNAEVIKEISEEAVRNDLEVTLWLDINNGMNRTGILPDDEALELFKLIAELPYLNAGGLHVYDGHIHDYLPSDRKIHCDNDFQSVLELKSKIERIYPTPTLIAGGSPTFPVHAQRDRSIELSPGTTVLWDYNSAQLYPDLNFLNAAMVMMRVVSKPEDNLLCLDLGHKALASEMPHPRVKIIGLEEYTVRNHSEEHMVVECYDAHKFAVGTVFYGIPYHICPTVAKYERAIIIRDGKACDEWKIEGRDRKISI